MDSLTRLPAAKIGQPWIPADRVAALLQLEPALLIVGLALGAWVFYRLFLKAVNEERHLSLRKQFESLAIYLVTFAAAFVAYDALVTAPDPTDLAQRASSYLGLLTLILGSVVLVKTFRILLSEYLFFNHMREGVPLLLINLFTLLFSILLGGWLVSEIFAVRFGPLLATSAAVSLVLGLAAQDTLGNLFAGIALQFDKPYGLGDWIEVQHDGQKWTGQVLEVSWRATVLTGWTEELMTVPNRVMAQSQISNYSLKNRPIVRSQVFRLPHSTPVEKARSALLQAASRVPELRKDPAPRVLINETSESWIPFKLIFFIDDFGSQYLIADQVVESCLRELRGAGLELATPQIQVQSSN